MTNWQSDEEGRVAIEKTSLSPLTTESKNQVRLLGCDHRVQVVKKSSFLIMNEFMNFRCEHMPTAIISRN